MQLGDVESTAAKTDLLENWINFKPSTSIETGVRKFAKRYLNIIKNKTYYFKSNKYFIIQFHNFFNLLNFNLTYII